MEWKTYKEMVKKGLDIFTFDENIPILLKRSIKEKKKIFIAGNGGSAALANHYTCDLSKGAVKNWKENKERFQVISLSSNISYITAIGNDESYDDIFRQQLINLAQEGDILMLISSSGNSPNIIKCAAYGKEIGMTVVGIVGFSGGKLKEIADCVAHVDFASYEVCEDVHAVFGHFLACYLRESNALL